MLRRVAAFCWPLRLVLLLVPFPSSPPMSIPQGRGGLDKERGGGDILLPTTMYLNATKVQLCNGMQDVHVQVASATLALGKREMVV